MSQLSQVPRRVSATVVLKPRLVHVRPATVPVPIATSQMSRKFPVRTRPLATVAERLRSVGALLASVPAIPAPRLRWNLLLMARLNAPAVEMRRTASARQENVLAAAAASKRS